MKRELFVDLVCRHLRALKVDEAEIANQREHINLYLINLGIGEESEDLDYESPEDFAEEIFKIIGAKVSESVSTDNNEELKSTGVAALIDVIDDTPQDNKDDEIDISQAKKEAVESEKKDFGFELEFAPFENNLEISLEQEENNAYEDFMPDNIPMSEENIITDDENLFVDIENAENVFSSISVPIVIKDNSESMTSESQQLEDLIEDFSKEAEDYYDDDSSPGEATREYDLQELISRENDLETDIYADDIEEEEYLKPTGNPIFFWILTVVLSPVWITIGVLSLLMIPVCYIIMLAFMVAYIPALIAMILGGSVATLAELVYSVIKFVKGEIYIGLFELGFGFLIVAFVICASVLIYRLGTKFVPMAIKKYWKFLSRLFKKIKRLIRKLREVCSI